MPPSFDIRPYQAQAIPAILDLTRVTLGDAPATRKTEAFWRWKHHANPFGPSYGLYAGAEGRVAGLRMLMRWRFCHPAGHYLEAVRAVDTATHPAYQRRGLFSTLTRQAAADLTEEGVHLIFNTPNTRSLPGYLKLGWQQVARWPLFIRPLRPWRMLARRLKLGRAAPPPDRADQYFGPAIMPWATFAGRYGHCLPQLISRWEQQRRAEGLRTPRDWAYLDWRYGQHPHLVYGVYGLERAGELHGFAVLRPNRRYGWQEIVLAELFGAGPDVTTLLQSLVGHLGGDYLVAHFAAGTLERAWLKRHGFIRLPGRGITFTVRPLNSPAEAALEPTAWDLSLGDLEIF